MDQGPSEFDGVKVVDPKNALLSECIVQMHIAVRNVNKKLMRTGKKFNFITPRDFLDLIR
jgi:dynein heavy chain 1, cytosolic